MAEERSTAERVAGMCKALSHPLRVEFIEALQADGGTLSASGFANAHDCDLSRISYHAVRLKNAGVLEVARVRKVRGATESGYSLTGTDASLALEVIALIQSRNEKRPPPPEG